MTLPTLLGRADVAARRVRLEHLLPGPAGAAWLALTSAEHTSRWLGRLEGAPQGVGDRFALWHDDQVRSSHLVVDWQPDRALAITWDFPAEPPSRVAFRLSEQVGGVRMSLQHDDLEDPLPYAAGWHRHLEYLHAHLAHRDRPLQDFWDGYDDLLERYRRST